jgi:ABC-type Na+ efflux pump permease subunit
LKTVLTLFRGSYLIFLKDRGGVMLTFIVPLVLMGIFGSIFGDSGSSAQGIPVAFLNQSTSKIGERIEATLDTMKTFSIVTSYKDSHGIEKQFDTTSIKEYVRNGKATAAVVLPPDAYTDTSTALIVKFYYDPKNEIEMQIVQGLVQQAIFSQIPSIIEQSGLRQAERYLGSGFGGKFERSIALTVSKYFKIDTSQILHPDFSRSRVSIADSGRNGSNFMNNIVKIDKEQLVGQQISNPWATRSVGGWAMTFLLFSLTAASTSLFEEKNSGVMLRLLTSPVSRVHILWSKYLFNMTLGIAQLTFMFVAGWILFQVDIFSNFFNLILIIIASAAACTSFGMLLAAFSKTRQQAQGLGTLLILTMSAVGGAWFPTSFMPPTIQFFSKLTIVYWSMDGFLQVLWRGVGTSGIITDVLVLFGTAIAVSFISIRQFRKGDIFA